MPGIRILHCSIVLLASFVFPIMADAQVVDTGAKEADGDPVAGAFFLGQVYPSGRLYIERVNGAAGEGGEEWPERLHFIPLDPEVSLPGASGVQTLGAQFVEAASWIRPRAIEGIFGPDSPCVPEGYQPGEGAGYASAPDPGNGRDYRDYFDADEWFDACGDLEYGAVYDSDGPTGLYFRVLAFRPDIVVRDLSHASAGAPRPLTDQERQELAQREDNTDICTVDPSDIRDATEMLRFTVEGSPLLYRLSRYDLACVHMSEVFVLDALQGDDVVAQGLTSRLLRIP